MEGWTCFSLFCFWSWNPTRGSRSRNLDPDPWAAAVVNLVSPWEQRLDAGGGVGVGGGLYWRVGGRTLLWEVGPPGSSSPSPPHALQREPHTFKLSHSLSDFINLSIIHPFALKLSQVWPPLIFTTVTFFHIPLQVNLFYRVLPDRKFSPQPLSLYLFTMLFLNTFTFLSIVCLACKFTPHPKLLLRNLLLSVLGIFAFKTYSYKYSGNDIFGQNAWAYLWKLDILLIIHEV